MAEKKDLYPSDGSYRFYLKSEAAVIDRSGFIDTSLLSQMRGLEYVLSILNGIKLLNLINEEEAKKIIEIIHGPEASTFDIDAKYSGRAIVHARRVLENILVNRLKRRDIELRSLTPQETMHDRYWHLEDRIREALKAGEPVAFGMKEKGAGLLYGIAGELPSDPRLSFRAYVSAPFPLSVPEMDEFPREVPLYKDMPAKMVPDTGLKGVSSISTRTISSLIKGAHGRVTAIRRRQVLT